MVLDKVSRLYKDFPGLEFIMVDGGISEDTISNALAAGANVLVSGTSVFGKQRKASMGIKRIRESLRKLSDYIPRHCLP
jgi:ribulose-phosphate 3-epimerase